MWVRVPRRFMAESRGLNGRTAVNTPPPFFPGLNPPALPDRKDIAMSKLKIMNGAPAGNEHLCRSCMHGQFMTGYRESDVLVICGNLNPAMVVPFPVQDCTDFWDRNRPSWDEMKKFALNLSTERRKPTPGFRQNGFTSVPVIVPDEDEETEDEAARVRRARIELIR